jgi:tRNA nucleotidyltransferase (CCA-adding enzyme)
MKIRRELHPEHGNPVLSVKDLAVDGKDVMDEMGVKEGPDVGSILAGLLEFVLDDPQRNEKKILMDHAKETWGV